MIEAIKAGKIRGAVGIVGCNNPKIKQDFGHVGLSKRLIANDILVLDTGCVSVALAKAGLKTMKALDLAGPGLREVCQALGIPPVLHVGSCVDNVRILVLVAALANALGCDISDLPVAGSAPEWYSETGRNDRDLLRSLRSLHPSGPHAAHYRQPERGQSS